MSTVSVTPFSQQCNQLVNAQVNKELTAAYFYQALSVYFGRHDIALQNVSQFFKNAADEEREHAEAFINYLQERGSEVVFSDIVAPKLPANFSLVDAFTLALGLEKDFFKSILSIHHAAGEHNEPHLASFLEDKFIGEQVHEEDKYVRIITTVKRMGSGLGEQLFDKDMISSFE